MACHSHHWFSTRNGPVLPVPPSFCAKWMSSAMSPRCPSLGSGVRNLGTLLSPPDSLKVSYQRLRRVSNFQCDRCWCYLKLWRPLQLWPKASPSNVWSCLKPLRPAIGQIKPTGLKYEYPKLYGLCWKLIKTYQNLQFFQFIFNCQTPPTTTAVFFSITFLSSRPKHASTRRCKAWPSRESWNSDVDLKKDWMLGGSMPSSVW